MCVCLLKFKLQPRGAKFQRKAKCQIQIDLEHRQFISSLIEMRDLHFTWADLILLASVNCIIYLVKFYSILADTNFYFRIRLKEPFKLSVEKRCPYRANH